VAFGRGILLDASFRYARFTAPKEAIYPANKGDTVVCSMKVAAALFLIVSAAAQPAKKTASLIVRDAATGEAPKLFTATLVHEERFARNGMNARLTNGVYRIDGIAPGVYRLELSNVPIQGVRSYQRVTQKTLTLVEGQELTIYATAPPGSSFGGHVLDYGGQPVAHAHVTVLSKGYVGGSLHYSAFSRLETDSLGAYSFGSSEEFVGRFRFGQLAK